MDANWQSKVIIPASGVTSLDYLLHWLELAKVQAQSDQLPVVEFSYEDDTFLLMRKEDFVERFGD